MKCVLYQCFLAITCYNHPKNDEMDPRMIRVILISAALILSTMTSADVLRMEGLNGKVIQAKSLPRRGMTKATVSSRYGQPQHKKAAVGDPPISRWDYPGYSVYFEYNIVLHTLVNKS